MLEAKELEKQSNMLQGIAKRNESDLTIDDMDPAQIHLMQNTGAHEKIEFWEELRPSKNDGIMINIGGDKQQQKELQMSVEDQIF